MLSIQRVANETPPCGKREGGGGGEVDIGFDSYRVDPSSHNTTIHIVHFLKNEG